MLYVETAGSPRDEVCSDHNLRDQDSQTAICEHGDIGISTTPTFRLHTYRGKNEYDSEGCPCIVQKHTILQLFY